MTLSSSACRNVLRNSYMIPILMCVDTQTYNENGKKASKRDFQLTTFISVPLTSQLYIHSLVPHIYKYTHSDVKYISHDNTMRTFILAFFILHTLVLIFHKKNIIHKNMLEQIVIFFAAAAIVVIIVITYEKLILTLHSPPCPNVLIFEEDFNTKKIFYYVSDEKDFKVMELFIIMLMT